MFSTLGFYDIVDAETALLILRWIKDTYFQHCIKSNVCRDKLKQRKRTIEFHCAPMKQKDGWNKKKKKKMENNYQWTCCNNANIWFICLHYLVMASHHRNESQFDIVCISFVLARLLFCVSTFNVLCPVSYFLYVMSMLCTVSIYLELEIAHNTFQITQLKSCTADAQHISLLYFKR